MKLKDETHHNPLVGNNPAPTAFNTLDQQSTDNHFPQHQSRQFLSEKEKERPTSDTGDGHKQQQHNLHSISNNLSVNSKCDPRSPFSVSSTSPSVVEQPNHNTEENTEEVTQSQESSTIHHHHHHHHYHNHYYNYYGNADISQGFQISLF